MLDVAMIERALERTGKSKGGLARAIESPESSRLLFERCFKLRERRVRLIGGKKHFSKQLASWRKGARCDCALLGSILPRDMATTLPLLLGLLSVGLALYAIS